LTTKKGTLTGQKSNRQHFSCLMKAVIKCQLVEETVNFWLAHKTEHVIGNGILIAK
jgi:hypothetical protein